MPVPDPTTASASLATAYLPPIRAVTPSHIAHWLRRGAHDLRRAGWLSLAHGVLVAAWGALLLTVAKDRFWLVAGAFSGFLVVAPVLATSLYAMSRALERGEPVNWRLVVNTWNSWQRARFVEPDGYWSLVRFGLLLALAGTGWVLTSAALITVLAPQPIHGPLDFLRHVVLAPNSHVFELWLSLGGLLAAPLFASSVITMPLLLDRRLGVLAAVLASWQAVLTNPITLALWAAVILGLTVVGMATALLGLVVILPLLGHASWHAYRDLADVGALPLRE